MNQIFKTVGVIGRQRKEDISDTLVALKSLLAHKKIAVVMETETATHLPTHTLPTYSRDELGRHCDLIIVVGGDGSLLNAARAAIDRQIPVLGINRGRLGFLTDIHPSELEHKVSEVLDGQYQEEQRCLLTATIENHGKTLGKDIALNEIVLMPGDIARMIEFAIEIDDQFVCVQRADGLIVATPTGSTAYALSGGGPILHPNLDATVLVPMFPHTLSARPIVIRSSSTIKIIISKENETSPRLSCDGQAQISLPLGSNVIIRKNPQSLRLIHPQDYNYFQTLRKKLHWSATL